MSNYYALKRTGILFLFCAAVFAGSAKIELTVQAVKFDRQVNQRTSTYTTPGHSNTNCTGTATSAGNTTYGNANCQTTSTPAQVHQNTYTTVNVSDVVEGNGMRYLIVCSASVRWSKCSPLIDGDKFPAEIDGTTMWITAHQGGNQGKKVRIKYKILDIRSIGQPGPQ